MNYDLNNSNYSNYNGGNQWTPSNSFDANALSRRVSAVMRRVYLKMTIAMIVTALTAFFALNSPLFRNFMMSPSAFIVLMIAQIGLVIALTAALHKLSNATATGMFYLYSVVTGLFLTPIFVIYTEASIVKTLLITAGTFGAMSVYGYFTTRDLTSWGRMLFFALLGLIICSIINIFTKSSGFDFLISAAGVLIFVGLTAWDTQKIKQWAAEMPGEATSKLATMGALSLYLDFINLFLYLLRFLNNRR